MRRIVYRRFDYCGFFVGEKEYPKRFKTLKAAQEHLFENGFCPINPNKKRCEVFTNNMGVNAYIM